MKKTEEGLKIKNNIQESERRRRQAKLDKMRIQIMLKESQSLTRQIRANNFMFLSTD